MKKYTVQMVCEHAEAVTFLLRGIDRAKKKLLKIGGITEECATRLAFKAFKIDLDPGDLEGHKKTAPPQLRKVG